MSDVSMWCRQALGSGIARTIFDGGNLSRVLAVTLDDERTVVIKVRPWEDRLNGCLAVQRHLAAKGYPCPAPISELDDVDGFAVHAETYVPGGEQRSPALGAEPYAVLLRRLVVDAPRVGEVAALLPSPPWTGWDRPGAATWPEQDDRGVNLNLIDGPAWVDDAAERVRAALMAWDAPLTVGHGDWESQNIRWVRNCPRAVHDWDSVVAQPEPAIVGLAAAVWAAQGRPGEAATVAQTEQFISAYETLCGGWTARDRAAAWSAGLWVRLFNAKKDAATGGGPQLDRLHDEVAERLRRAGLDA
jgi:hypothetical protein